MTAPHRRSSSLSLSSILSSPQDWQQKVDPIVRLDDDYVSDACGLAGVLLRSPLPSSHLLTHFTHSLTNSHTLSFSPSPSLSLSLSLYLGHARSGGDAFAWARERLRPALERRKALEARCGEVAQADEPRMIVKCMYVIVSELLLRSIMPPMYAW